MDDLIRRSDVLNCSHIVYIEYLETDDGGFIEGYADCIPVIKKRDVDSIPAVDAVEVVRCRECKMANPCSDEREMYCTMSHSYKRKNYYCADGQSREDGLCESLKRGLEEAIAYEKGEVELRTERRKDGDGDG